MEQRVLWSLTPIHSAAGWSGGTRSFHSRTGASLATVLMGNACSVDILWFNATNLSSRREVCYKVRGGNDRASLNSQCRDWMRASCNVHCGGSTLLCIPPRVSPRGGRTAACQMMGCVSLQPAVATSTGHDSDVSRVECTVRQQRGVQARPCCMDVPVVHQAPIKWYRIGRVHLATPLCLLETEDDYAHPIPARECPRCRNDCPRPPRVASLAHPIRTRP